MGPAATGIAKVGPRQFLGLGGGLEAFHGPLPLASCVPPERVGCAGSLRAGAERVCRELHEAGGAGGHPAAVSQLGHWQ